MHKSIELGGHSKSLSLSLSLSQSNCTTRMQNRPHRSFIHSVSQSLIHSLKHSYICSVLFSSVRLSIMVRYAPLESPQPGDVFLSTVDRLRLRLPVAVAVVVCLIFIKSAPLWHCPLQLVTCNNLQQLQLLAPLSRRPSV